MPYEPNLGGYHADGSQNALTIELKLFQEETWLSSYQVNLLDSCGLSIPAVSALGTGISSITFAPCALGRTCLEWVYDVLASRSPGQSRTLGRLRAGKIRQIGRVIPRHEHRIVASSRRVLPFA